MIIENQFNIFLEKNINTVFGFWQYYIDVTYKYAFHASSINIFSKSVSTFEMEINREQARVVLSLNISFDILELETSY
jgi:hypothetical protein